MAERLLHVVGSQAVAGAENHLFTLLPALVRGGNAVRLINFERPGPVQPLYLDRLSEMEAAGVEVRRVSLAHRFDPRGAWHVAREVRSWCPDVVHTHLIVADLLGSIGGWLGGRGRANAPVRIASRHRDYAFSEAERRRFRRFYRLADLFIDAHIAISRAVKSLIETEERLAPGIVSVVHYGIEDQCLNRGVAAARLRQEWAVPSGVPLLGTVARLIDLKGHRYALDAARRLRDEGLDFRWAFVGDGPLRASIEADIASAGLTDRVFVTGFRSDVPEIMAALDLLVHPTTGEGFGLITLEAMVQATPLAVSRTGAMPEILEEGRSGWFFENRDAVSMASAVGQAVRDPASRARIGQAGRARFEAHFTVERMVEGVEAAYMQALKKRRGSS